jgi:hypothetical protein
VISEEAFKKQRDALRQIRLRCLKTKPAHPIRHPKQLSIKGLACLYKAHPMRHQPIAMNPCAPASVIVLSK